MDIHEYQAKECFALAGIPVPPGQIATTPDQAESIANEYACAVMVKAQVHSGGRGKAGGVKYCNNAEEAREHATNILGMEINGLTVEKVLVTPAEDIESEAYVGVLIDRKRQSATFMVSPEG
jgi:succinyl-CoA synthetase beta subunit